MKKRSEAKVKWAVNCFNEWHNARLGFGEVDEIILNTDLNDVDKLMKENLEYCLIRFVPEVTKTKGDGEYPGKTLYQMIVAIQKFLEINKLRWKLIHGNEFHDLRTVLDNVMKQRCADNVGNVRKQADIISYEYEEKMWNSSVLGEDTPDKLRDTVLFLLGINIALRAVDEHYYLRRDMPEKMSQLAIEKNSKGVECVVFREDSCTKTYDGGLGQMRKERKIVWIYPSKNINRCPVRLLKKYLSLCPKNYFKKPNFYLQSLKSPHPKQWYVREVVGQNKVKEVVKNLLSSAEIDGYFTNHSLRCTGGTRLFQAGIDHKLVKEVTGHRSDAVDCYQITSEEQREHISRVMEGSNVVECNDIQSRTETVVPKDKETESNACENSVKVCDCKGKNEPIGNKVCSIINKIVEENLRTGKTIVKLEIEITNE